MKRQLLLFSLLFLSLISLQARSFVLDGINYNISSTVVPYSVSVTSGISYTGDIVIPSTVSYNDTVFSVTSIYSNAFIDSDSLTSVTIPNSVSTIGTGAFYGCSELTSINLSPDNPYFIFTDGILYSTIQNQLIYCINSKTGKIDIPKTVKVIGIGAFYGCKGITSVSVPNSITVINSLAFNNCTGLTTVSIGDSTNTGTRTSIIIQSTAFAGCSGLTSLSLYEPIASYYSPFQNLASLKTLAIGNSVTTIDYSAFSTLPGLTKVILGRADLSPVTISVYMGAFNASTLLDTLNLNCNLVIKNYSTGAVSPFSTISFLSIGENVSSIGDYAFIGSTNLKNIIVPNAVTSIGQSTFAGCSSVTGITLGSSVAQIGSGVFTGCSSLLNINVDNANTTYSSINAVVFSKDQLTFIQYPTGRSGEYEIPDFVKTIGTNAFMSCQGLQSIIIPQSITSVQSSAFANCSGLTSVSIGHIDNISSAVVSIASDAFTSCINITKLILNKNFSFTSGDNSAFKNLTSLATLQIGNGVTSIPDYSFSGCSGLSTLRLGQNNNVGNVILTVSVYAFSGCSNLTTLELNRNMNISGYESPFTTISTLSVGNGVTFIGDQSFYQCINLSSILLPSSVTKIGNGAFQYCSKLDSISFPGINTIGQSAFWGCTALTSVAIPIAVKIIQSSTFYGCSALSSLSLGDSITQIQDNAFFGCIKLPAIVIPNTVKSIGNYAFSGCTGLTSVIPGTSLTSIGTYAFSGNNALQSIQFPGSLTNIADNAFENCSGLMSLLIPGTIKTIGAGAFTNCSGITTLTIGDANNPGSPLSFATFPFAGCTGVTSLILNKNITDDLYSSPFMSLKSLSSVTISNRVSHLNTFAFYGCSKLTSVIVPNSVASIGEAAFQGCTSLTDVKLPIGLYFLPNQIFYGCTNLKSLEIPSNVTTIGSYAFYQCSSLNSLTIPKAVILIGPIAFNGCTGLTELIAANPVPAPIGTNGFNGIDTTTCKLYVPIGSRSAYQTEDNWKYFANIYEKEMKDSIQSTDSISGFVSKTIYINAGGLTAVLTSTELATVNKLTIVGSMNSTDLSKIRAMPALCILDMENTTIQYNTIPSNFFSGMKNILSVIFPSTITSVGTRAFENCSGLIYVTFTSANTSIENNAFANCSGLMMVTLPSSITSIKTSVFYGCSRLFAINIPSSVTTIESNAFAKCNGFTSINLPNSITTIGEYAFAGCYGLRSFTVPPLVTVLSSGLFRDCYSLKTLYLSPALTSISDGEVFASCRNLNSIYNYQTTPLANTDFMTFYYLDMSNCILYVPEGSLDAYKQANGWNSFQNIIEMTNTGLSSQNIYSLCFYPNPVKEGFHIDGLTESGMLTLTNLNGSVLFSKQVIGNEYISISTLPEGIYIAKIVTKDFSMERKIIKK
ncbi:MAG: leucine-rich repeat domain-containing protein [Paludibacter sp.]